MKVYCNALAVLSACVSFSGACAVFPESAIRKKYVAFGWEFGNASVSNLLQAADQLDSTSLDGIGIYLRLPRKGRLAQVSRYLLHEPTISWSELEPLLPAFGELAAHRSMQESFIKSFGAPTNRLDWASDADWARVGVNMRMLARLAKRSGLKGLSIDDEDYHKQHQFSRLAGEPPSRELAALVRRRAHEIFAPVFSEYPEMTVFFFRLFTAGKSYAGSGDPLAASVANGDLWPSFVNGILDVLPPSAKIVDGHEESYEFDSLQNDYQKGYVSARSRLVNMADGAANRQKYRVQVSYSPAIYLDMYCTPRGAKYYSAPLAGTRFGHLASNLGQITYVSDGYVWFWGERRQWVEWEKIGLRMRAYGLWQEVFPDLDETLAALKNPDGYAVRKFSALKRSGMFHPENGNWTCASQEKVSEKNPVAPYSSWPDKAQGRRNIFRYDLTVGEDDSSSLCAEDVPSGCIIMDMDALNPGAVYLVGLSARGDAVSATLYWKRDGKWDFLTLPGCAIALSDPDVKGWRHALTSVVVPAGANGFGLQLGVSQKPGEKSWFDNVFAVRVTGTPSVEKSPDEPNRKE